VDLLFLDDFALQPMDALDAASTLVTSNREPAEWIAQMVDDHFAESATDRVQSAAYMLVLESESYRPRPRPRREPLIATW
jgi:DNA replication protein DnaC